MNEFAGENSSEQAFVDHPPVGIEERSVPGLSVYVRPFGHGHICPAERSGDATIPRRRGPSIIATMVSVVAVSMRIVDSKTPLVGQVCVEYR